MHCLSLNNLRAQYVKNHTRRIIFVYCFFSLINLHNFTFDYMILQFINVSEEKHWTGLSFENWTLKAILFVIYQCFRISHTSKELAKGETLYFRMDRSREATNTTISYTWITKWFLWSVMLQYCWIQNVTCTKWDQKFIKVFGKKQLGWARRFEFL